MPTVVIFLETIYYWRDIQSAPVHSFAKCQQCEHTVAELYVRT
jgi:hypothetical protein